MKKDFSILKWIVFPLIVAALSVSIGYTNIVMFGFDGSTIYLVILAAIVGISFILVLHTGNREHPIAMRAAFIFESVGIFALLVTAIFAIQVSRELQGTKIASTENTEQIKAIATLKSSRAQTQLAKTISSKTDIASSYKNAEAKLFWPLVCEGVWYFLALVVVFGITILLPATEHLTPPASVEWKPAKLSANHTLTTASAPLLAPKSTASAALAPQNAITFAHTSSPGVTFRLSHGTRTKVIYFCAGRGKSARYCCSVSDPEYAVLATTNYARVRQFVLDKLAQRDTAAGKEVLELILRNG